VRRLLRDGASAVAAGAAARAEAAGAPDALVLAALLYRDGEQHDGDPRLSAAWLGRHFGPAVAEPVRLLGDAERWLATVDRTWFEGLDDEGLRSLGRRGGLMTPLALRSFERRPYARDAATLLRFVTASKVAAAVDCAPHGAPHGAQQASPPDHEERWLALVERLALRDTRATA